MVKMHLALDDMGHDRAHHLAQIVGPHADGLKVNDFADYQGLEVVDRLRHYSGGKTTIWIDFKFVDVKRTVQARSRRWRDAGADIVTVYYECGADAINAAIDTGLQVYVVLMLTSLDENEFNKMHGQGQSLHERFKRRANYVLTEAPRVSGFISSVNEVALLKGLPNLGATKVIVPGSRSPGVEAKGQVRTGTPVKAVMDGADELVIGSECTDDKVTDPVGAFLRIKQDIAPYC